jgi:hypothetical protein
MRNKFKLYLLFIAILPLLQCVSQNKSPGKINFTDNNYRVVFPMNEYLTTDGSTPYPILVKGKFQHINTSSFVNVMNYGATGNGLDPDDIAIAKAFEACKDGSGVLFPGGKVFLIQNLIHIPVNKNIIVSAYGATFKMAANTGYNAIALECDSIYSHKILWLGGMFDGNKENQSYPGSSSKKNRWSVSHSNYGLLTIKDAQFALVKDVILRNTVYDGVNLFECELGVIADSKAYGGVDLNYSKLRRDYGKGHQATYFKCTRRNSQVVYFINLDCKEGSIGVQYSTNTVSDSSLTVVSNCHFLNQSQDALHFESCRKLFVYGSTIEADNLKNYRADLHISNSCAIASIKNCEFNNGRIDFHNASNLLIGMVENCHFVTHNPIENDTASLRNFIHNTTYVKSCTFQGKTKEEQVMAKYIVASNFNDFDVAVKGAVVVYECHFKNGKMSIKNQGKSIIKECKFTDTNDLAPSDENSSPDSSWKQPLTTSIRVDDQRNSFLGYIVK